MSDFGNKISELNSLTSGNMAGELPLSLTLSSGTLATNKITLSQVRDLFDFDHAFETVEEGIAATVENQLFYVYVDSNKLSVNEYIRTNIGASAVIGNSGTKKTIYIPELLKHVKVQVDSFAALRQFKPWREGQVVYLKGYYSDGVTGGGEFVGHLGTATDDGGVTAAGNGFYWQRYNSENIVDAQWFGVIADGGDRGNNIDKALNFISVRGGELKFPNGEINWGTLRKVFNYSANLKPFTISGNGDSTVFTFDDVAPPVLQAGANWVKEPPLISFIGVNGNQFIPKVVLKNFSMDYSRQKNKGGTDLATLGTTHPTPYSLGVWGIYFFYADSPTIENVTLNNIYGDGIIVRKSFEPTVKSCQFYNVSAGNIIARTDGNMASDSNGGAIFFWACVGGLIDNVTAWNQRTYQVHVNSTDNGTDVYNTLCGYIGIWTEYPWDQNMTSATPETAPPRMTSIISAGNLTSNWDNEAKGCTIQNCTVYGYTIGIKSEGFSETNIVHNMVLNCYLPIFPASTRATVADNFTDMLYCDNRTCPQGGYQSIRGHLVCHNYSTVDDGARRGVEFRGNKCYCVSYPAFRSNRSGSMFVGNMFRFSRGSAFAIDATISTLVKGVIIKDNTFFFDSTISSTVTSNIAYHDGLVFSGNRFVNKSNSLVTIAFRNSSKNVKVENNFFEGWFFVALQCTGIFDKNIMDVQNQPIANNYHLGNVFQATARAVISRNEFRINSSATSSQIVVSSDNSVFERNTIHVQNTGTPTLNGLVSSESAGANQIFDGNLVTQNPFNTALFYLNSPHAPTFIGNVNSGNLIYIFGTTIYSPITLERNKCTGLFTTLATEKNTGANLSSKVTAYVGMKMYYILPNANGAEGEIYTAQGWKTFGNIAA